MLTEQQVATAFRLFKEKSLVPSKDWCHRVIKAASKLHVVGISSRLEFEEIASADDTSCFPYWRPYRRRRKRFWLLRPFHWLRLKGIEAKRHHRDHWEAWQW